jgi:hypothetical protein
MSGFDEAAFREERLRLREETLRNFRDPQRSPYATVARHDFSDSTPLVFGSAADCDAPLEGLSPHHLRARVEENSFELEAIDLNTNFILIGAADAIPQTRATVQPGARVRVGRYVLRFSHQNFPAVLVLDTESPQLALGPPPLWFDPDPAFRVEAKLLRDEHPREEIVLSTRGQKRRGLRLGTLSFELLKTPLQLTAIRLLEPGSDEASFSIFFRDLTTGKESYPVGRYVDPKPIGDRWLVDFNGAYNPSCAFSPLYNCPIPPRENRLAVAVRAGERDPRDPSATHE